LNIKDVLKNTKDIQISQNRDCYTKKKDLLTIDFFLFFFFYMSMTNAMTIERIFLRDVDTTIGKNGQDVDTGLRRLTNINCVPGCAVKAGRDRGSSAFNFFFFFFCLQLIHINLIINELVPISSSTLA
jgi:hypothetical protein